MHLAGVIGAASAPHEWENKARAMLSPGQAKPQEGETMAGVFLCAARVDAADIRRLCGINTEQMAIGLHHALLQASDGGRRRWVTYASRWWCELAVFTCTWWVLGWLLLSVLFHTLR